MQDAIRLPNKSQAAGDTGPGALSALESSMASPTSYLSGGRIESFFTADDKNSVQIEGEMIRKATETKLKKYWYCLLGKELYVYKNRQEDKHKGMHQRSILMIRPSCILSHLCSLPQSLEPTIFSPEMREIVGSEQSKRSLDTQVSATSMR